MAGTADYQLLGPLVVRRGRRAVAVPPGKQRAVLATLLLAAGRTVGIAELAAAVWEDGPPPTARVTLQNYVARLRASLGPGGAALVTRPEGYQFLLRPGELDVHRLEAALADGRAAASVADWERAAARLRAGLALWRGEPLADVAAPSLAARELPRLAELRWQAAEGLAQACLELGRAGEMVAELRRLVAQEPLRERLHELLMAALAQDGQQGAALAAFGAARQVLAAELGTEPGARLQELHARILAGDAPPGSPAPAVPASPGPAARYALPAVPAGFTGRAGELARVTAAAGASRACAIQAINGMPGVGKTALAIRAAHLVRDRFPDGQLFIDLQGHTEGAGPVTPADALAGLLAAAGLDGRQLPADLDGRAALWRDKMAGRRSVLVLDNAASSAQVTPLLPGGDDCLVLVTSRRQLADLPGAAAPVQVDVLPPAQAAQLLARLAPRAAAEPLAAVAELAGLAGHLPLAITLLARTYNRHPAWSLADLAAQTRAWLLTATAGPDSVAAAFEVSWQHLGPAQRHLLTHLGLHLAATTDGHAAAALAGVPAGEAALLLDQLHGEGLLTETGYRRYGLHDLIRQFAAARAQAIPAADRAAATGRLLDYYARAGALATALLTGDGAPGTPPAGGVAAAGAGGVSAGGMPPLATAEQALAWARAARAGLLACLDYAAAAGDRRRVVALTAAVSELLLRDGPWTEAAARQETAAAAAAALGEHAARAAALRGLGKLRMMTGEYAAATQALEEARGACRAAADTRGEAAVQYLLATAQRLTGNFTAALANLTPALATFRALGDVPGQARVLAELGNVQHQLGDYRAATASLAGGLAAYRASGNRTGEAGVLADLGMAGLTSGDLAAAGAALEQALAIFADLGSLIGQANALWGLGEVRLAAGDHAGAASALDEALARYGDLGSLLGRGITLRSCGALRRATGDLPAAQQALEEALGIFTELGDRTGAAKTHNELGRLRRALGQPDQAARCHRAAAELARRAGSPHAEAVALAGLGRCALDVGDRRLAAVELRRAWEIFERLGAAEAAGVGAELAALSGR